MEKKAIRILDNLAGRQSCKASFLKLEIMTVPSMYILSNLLHVKQNVNSFSTQSTNHNYLTRQRNNLVTPHVRLSKSINSHVYQQLKIFNKLPLYVRNLPYKDFKSFITKCIRKHNFYTVDEYFDGEFSWT